MTPADPSGESDGAAASAADWVVRLSREGVIEADWLAFTAWLDAAPVDRPELHRQAFDRAQSLWLELDRLAARPSATSRRGTARGRGAAVRQRPAAWINASAAAGIAALAVCAAVIFNHLPAQTPGRAPTSAPPVAYATLAGQRRSLRLPDGTRVMLDGASRLSLGGFGPAGRTVALQQGEAMFDVVHEPSRPFSVELGAARVRVLGTAFDIVREGGDIRVGVARGAVRLETPQGDVRLPAGRSAALEDGRLQVRSVALRDVGAWRDGRRLYLDQPMANIVADLNRSLAQPIRLGDAEARRMRFTGVLVLGPRDVMVRRLTALAPLRARPGGRDGVVLSSRAP